jgi:hypothetical protein
MDRMASDMGRLPALVLVFDVNDILYFLCLYVSRNNFVSVDGVYNYRLLFLGSSMKQPTELLNFDIVVSPITISALFREEILKVMYNTCNQNNRRQMTHIQTFVL